MRIKGYCNSCLWFWGTVKIKMENGLISTISRCDLSHTGTVPNGYCHAYSKKKEAWDESV